MASTTPHPKRPWLQFSLKSILVLTLIVAAFCAGLTFSSRKLEQAIEAERAARRRAETLEKNARETALAGRIEAARLRGAAELEAAFAKLNLELAQEELEKEQQLRQMAELALKNASREALKKSDRSSPGGAKRGGN